MIRAGDSPLTTTLARYCSTLAGTKRIKGDNQTTVQHLVDDEACGADAGSGSGSERGRRTQLRGEEKPGAASHPGGVAAGMTWARRDV